MEVDPSIGGPTTVGHDELRIALKAAASALKKHDIGFALAGGYALWANGAPEPVHDVDLVVTEADVQAAADCLQRAGFEIERPPEDWLFKAHLGGAMVDVLHRINTVPVDVDLVGSARLQEALGLHIPVLGAGQVITSRLLSMTEQYCDFGALLPAVRAVREQLDWAEIQNSIGDNDFAAAFLYLACRLGLAEPPTAGVRSI